LLLNRNHKYGSYSISNINYILKPFFFIHHKFPGVEKRLYKEYINNLSLYIKNNGCPDIIHFHSISGMGELPYILNKQFNIPVVVTEHFSGYALNKIKFKEIEQAKKNLKISSRFFAVSDFYRNNLNKLFNTNIIKTLPNNLGGLVIEKSKYIKKNKDFTFICVGNLFEVKNQELAIFSFKKFTELNSNARLNIVGMGPEFHNLKDLVKSLDLDKKVNFLGKLNRGDTLSEISKAHVLLVTSHIETFSVVTIEALALKTIVVSTKCGGPEMLIDQTNGLICEFNENYAESMIKIFRNYSVYNLEKIQNNCLKKYSGEVISKRLMDEYLDVLNEMKN